MAYSQVDLLSEIAGKLNKVNKTLCCKLDQVIEASGGSPVLYNTPGLKLIAPNGEFINSGIEHSVTFTVIGDPGQTADIAINHGNVTVPVGFSATWVASTVFEPNSLKVYTTGTASVLVTFLS